MPSPCSTRPARADAYGISLAHLAQAAGAGAARDFADIRLLPLPPYAPELNPVEQVWAYLRANLLGRRVWNSHNAIVEACCDAWNKLMNTPQRLASITRRTWAKAASG